MTIELYALGVTKDEPKETTCTVCITSVSIVCGIGKEFTELFLLNATFATALVKGTPSYSAISLRKDRTAPFD